jgi:hypothetical protein
MAGHLKRLTRAICRSSTQATVATQNKCTAYSYRVELARREQPKQRAASSENRGSIHTEHAGERPQVDMLTATPILSRQQCNKNKGITTCHSPWRPCRDAFTVWRPAIGKADRIVVQAIYALALRLLASSPAAPTTSRAMVPGSGVWVIWKPRASPALASMVVLAAPGYRWAISVAPR